MTYIIRLFAGLAEAMGTRELQLEAQHPLTVSDLKLRLQAQFPELKTELDGTLVAINQRYAHPSDTFTERDEVALIPPVGGGSDEPPLVRVTRQPLDVNFAYSLLENVYCGGTVLFCGTVREWTKGRQTQYLTYEAYADMAILQMQNIGREVAERWPGVHTLQWHRIGDLHPTDIAVICAAAAPHRDVAFEAARVLIDRLKKEAPIWKKEYYADGETIWSANPE
jgi:molybdopterin converting factor subunit 1